MKILLIIIASLILLIDIAFLGSSINAATSAHAIIHDPNTPQDLYETLSDLRIRMALSALLFGVLGIPAVGWLVMLVKSYKATRKP